MRSTPPLGIERMGAYSALVALCASGLPAVELLDVLADRLRAAVPHAIGCWSLTDPWTMLNTVSIERDIPFGAYMRVLDYDLEGEDFATMREIARSDSPVWTIHEATGGEPQRSLRMRNVAMPMGLASELRAVFRTGQACWGTACMVRGQDALGFSAVEVQFMIGLSDHIAHGLRSALLFDAARADELSGVEAPGMIVLAGDNSIDSLTVEAQRWLHQIPPDRAPARELPTVIYDVVRCARAAIQQRLGVPPARARVRLLSGHWLSIHAARLREPDGNSGRTAVMLEPTRPAQLAPLMFELHDLTDRERQVVQLLVRGLGTDDIARALWISEHTVRDHTKNVFAKLRVTSRPELTAKLYYDHATLTCVGSA